MPVKNAKRILALKRRRVRETESKYLIEGIRLCEEAVDSTPLLEQLIFCRESLDRNERLARLFDSAVEKNLPIQQTNRRAFQGMCETQSPQGVLGVVQMPQWDRSRILNAQANFLILDRISDPGNLGMILRTAEAAGAAAVFLTRGSVELFNPKVVRATMGAIFRLPVFAKENPDDLLESLSERNISLVAASVGGIPYHQLDKLKRVALLLGNEAYGIDSALVEKADQTISIPMAEPVNSLNVAVAAGILLYKVKELQQELAS